MRYSKFKIVNFKGIRDITLNLDKRPISPVYALVGLNESGKTTILQAIDWLLNKTIPPEDLVPKSMLVNFNKEISVEATLIFSDKDRKLIDDFLWKKCNKFILSQKIDSFIYRRVYSYQDSICNDQNRYVGLSFTGKTKRAKTERTFSIEDKYGDILWQYIKSQLLPPIIYYSDFLFDFPEKIYLEAAEGEELSTKEKLYRDVVQDILHSIDPKMEVETHLVNRYTQGQEKALDATLYRLSSKVTKEVFSIWKSLLKIDSTIGMEIFFGQGLKDDEHGIYLQVTVKEKDQNYQVRERSLGFRWFFAFFLFTIFRAYRYSSQVQAIFLLDEPASNLHSTAQQKILGVFDQLPNKQTVIYTTHSHHMINPKWLSGMFVVKNEPLDYSNIDIQYSSLQTNIITVPYFRYVAENPEDTDYFKPVLDALDYQPSKLELVPELVMFEGKNDYYTLRYLENLELGNLPKKYHFSPGTGKDKLEFLVHLYLAWGKNFITLLDDDKGGRSTYKRLQKQYGPLVENRVFKLSQIDTSFKGFAMEDFFDKRDKLRVIKTLYPDETVYQKEKFNVALQQLYLEDKTVRLTSYTKDRFKKIFTFIDTKLTENRIRD